MIRSVWGKLGEGEKDSFTRGLLRAVIMLMCPVNAQAAFAKCGGPTALFSWGRYLRQCFSNSGEPDKTQNAGPHPKRF